jgi:hypothetical protein
LVQVFTLGSEILLLAPHYPSQLSSLLCDTMWFQKLGCVADVFRNINEVNLSFHSKTVMIISTRDKLESFLSYTEFWRICAEKGNKVKSIILWKVASIFTDVSAKYSASRLME